MTPSRRFFRLALVTAMALAVTVPAMSSDAHASAAGEWKSSSGNTFIIPKVRGSKFDIINHAKNGKWFVYSAWWIKGMEGTQFKYGNPRSPSTGTFNARNPNTLRVVSAQRKAFTWTRIAKPPARPMAASGLWKSTSGNIFTIPNTPNKFAIIMTKPDGKKFVFPASWVRGMRGTQFNYGKGCQGTINQRAGTIRAACQRQKASIWTRVGAPARTVTPRPRVAQSPLTGTWTARDGSRWKVPAAQGQNFDVVYKSRDGRRSATYRAAWARGLKNTQMKVYLDRETLTVTYSANNPRQLQVSSRYSKTTWTR